MVSDKIKALKTTLSLARATNMAFNRGFVSLLQRQLSDIHEQVLMLEQAQVPSEARRCALRPVVQYPLANDRGRP